MVHPPKGYKKKKKKSSGKPFHDRYYKSAVITKPWLKERFTKECKAQKRQPVKAHGDKAWDVHKLAWAAMILYIGSVAPGIGPALLYRFR